MRRSILCALFGHKPGENVHDGAEYLVIIRGPVDGIGREHASVYGGCQRCFARYRVGKVHLFDGHGWNEAARRTGAVVRPCP
jgi:hypothetical protein